MIAYKLVRQWSGNWMFCGTTADEVASAVKNEIDADEGLSADARRPFQIAAYDTTQSAIDNMPEFKGW